MCMFACACGHNRKAAGSRHSSIQHDAPGTVTTRSHPVIVTAAVTSFCSPGPLCQTCEDAVVFLNDYATSADKLQALSRIAGTLLHDALCCCQSRAGFHMPRLLRSRTTFPGKLVDSEELGCLIFNAFQFPMDRALAKDTISSAASAAVASASIVPS